VTTDPHSPLIIWPGSAENWGFSLAIAAHTDRLVVEM